MALDTSEAQGLLPRGRGVATLGAGGGGVIAVVAPSTGHVVAVAVVVAHSGLVLAVCGDDQVLANRYSVKQNDGWLVR